MSVFRAKSCSRAIGSYGVEDGQFGDTSRAYGSGLASPLCVNTRKFHTGTEETGSGRLLLDITGGGAGAGLGKSRGHFGGLREMCSGVNASGTCASRKFYLNIPVGR